MDYYLNFDFFYYSQSRIHSFEGWKQFASSIFYVGQGTSGRICRHINESLKKSFRAAMKQERINEIWDSGYDVTYIRPIWNVSWAESITCESFIIEGIGLANLTNTVVSKEHLNSSVSEQERIGTSLIYAAYNIFVEMDVPFAHKHWT